MKTRLVKLMIECCEARICFSSVGFTARPITGDGSTTEIIVADVDGDRDLDIVRATLNIFGADVEWLENTGQGEFLQRQNLPYDDLVWGIALGDLDSDGDLDLVTKGDIIRWHENLDGNGLFGEAKPISAPLHPEDIALTDLDGDGDLDVVGINPVFVKGLWWHENVDGKGNFGAEETLYHPGAGGRIPASIATGDIDGNGDVDILSTTVGLPDEFSESVPATIQWYPNLGAGVFGLPIDVDTGRDNCVEFPCISDIPNFPGSPSLADVDGDGDLDFVVAGLASVHWSENLDGRGSFGPSQYVSGGNTVDSGVRVEVVDIDNDGDLDLVSSFGWSWGWHENLDGKGDFAADRMLLGGDFLTRGAFAVGDMDGDGDVDIVTESAWYESDAADLVPGDLNRDGVVTFPDFLILSANFGRTDEDVRRSDGDLDKDGQIGFADFLIFAAHFERQAKA